MDCILSISDYINGIAKHNFNSILQILFHFFLKQDNKIIAQNVKLV